MAGPTHKRSRPGNVLDQELGGAGRPGRAAAGPLQPLLAAGNTALTGLMRAAKQDDAGLIDLPGARPGPAQQTHKELPEWSPAQLGIIQKHLKRIGLYRLRVDRQYGPGTEFALIEAFGDNEWRYQPVETTIAALAGAKKLTSEKGGPTLPYGHLLGDGVLTLSVGVGTTRGISGPEEERAIQAALIGRGFTLDPGDGAVLMQLGGRQGADAGDGELYVRRNVLTYTPPAGEPRQVHAVVRLIRGNDWRADSESSANTFARDMTQTDVAMYAGSDHGGSGPGFGDDFKRLSIGNDPTPYSPSDFEWKLAEQGKEHGRDAWAQFLFLEQNSPGYLKVVARHSGKVYLNTEEPANADFITRVLYYTMRRDGVTARTGQHGSLGAAATAQQHEHPFRVLLFDGVSNQEFLKEVRDTPGFDSSHVAMYANQRPTHWVNRAQELVAFIDGIIAQQSPQDIIGGVEKRSGVARSFTGDGVQHSTGELIDI
jgi:hypothetical protein